MASYPSSIFEPRTVENLEGIEYNPDDKKTLFAEDYNKSNDEILAIEQTLGTEVNGAFETLAARINDLEAVVSGMNDNHFPVGTVYFNAADPRNPSEIMGFGDWEPYAEGLVIAGKSSTGEFDTLGAELGSDSVTLTLAELPSHNHDTGTLATSSAGAHTHNLGSGNWYHTTGSAYSHTNGAGSHNFTGQSSTVPSAGAHTHNVTGSTGSSGGGEAFSIIQPTKVSMAWERVA